MSEFSIIPKNVLLNVDILKSCGSKMENQIASVEKVKAGISLGSSTDIVKAQLSASIEKLAVLRNGLQTMSGQLHNIASEYVNADIRVEDNKMKTSLNEEQNKSDSDSSEDEDIDWKKIWDELVRLAKKRVITEAEFISFRLDLEKIIFAGIDKLVSGYDTKMLVGDGISSSNISGLSDDYDTYIMTTYNNESDLSSMIHTVSITKENGVYVVHNDYEGTRSYDSLNSAVSGYNNGNGEPITLIGIKE